MKGNYGYAPWRYKKSAGGWLNNAITLHRDIQHPRPSVTIQSDTSKLGWGAVLGAEKTGGRWTPLETESHINVLELLAALFALKSYCSKLGNCNIQPVSYTHLRAHETDS